MTDRHPKTITRIPRLSLHKGTGQARAKFRGRDHYFGRYGSPEAHRRYAQWISEITADPGEVPVLVRARAGQHITLAELVNAFEEHLETTLEGRTEDAIRTARSEARIAGDLLLDRHASVSVTDFDAPMLVEIRDRVARRTDTRALVRKLVERDAGTNRVMMKEMNMNRLRSFRVGPVSVTDTTQHLDAGINAALYGPDSVFGATEEEIETALLLAADLQFRSTMLYGHEYSADVLKSQIKKMTGG